MFDIVALGECLIDFTPAGIDCDGMPLYRENPGGAPANVLAMASILGSSTSFIGKVGKDAFGSFLRSELEAAGLDCSCLISDAEHPTTLAFVSLDETGNRSFSFYRNRSADVMLVPGDLGNIPEARIFHFGSVSMTDEPARSTTVKIMMMYKKNGSIISYDPNYRPLLWKDEKTAVSVMKSVIPSCDIVKVSDEEMSLISGTDAIQEGARRIMAMGPSVVVVTCGSKGSFIIADSCFGFFHAFDVKTIDTTGAGDSFLGSFLYFLLQHGIDTPEMLRKAGEDELRDAMVFANAAGSLATMKYGAIPSMPSRAEIENCIRTCKLLKEVE